MNELDQFVKHQLHIKHYLRYTDDFIIVHHEKEYLEKVLIDIYHFLHLHLKLCLHPRKIVLRKFTQGADFLGYVVLPQSHHRKITEESY